MAHFAILCPDDAGPLLSIGPVGQELVRRGHRVTLVAPPSALPLARLLDLPLHVVDGEPVPYSSSFFLRQAARLCAASGQIDIRDYLCWHAEVILQLVPPALRELAVDGVLVDHIFTAGGTAAEHAGVPFVTVCSALMWNEEWSVPPSYTSWSWSPDRGAQWRNRLGYAGWHWFMRPILGVINRYRRRWNLPHLDRVDDTFSSLAQISQLCPEFDFPRRELPNVFHYVGSLTAGRELNTDHQFPWDRLDGRRLIFASLGTVADPGNLSVFPRILAACAGLDAQLILALGKWSDDAEREIRRESLGEIPANAVVVDFAPQLALLDRAALLITHAGVNTVLESLSRAVPMVALPRGVDQPGMGSRVAHAGVGLTGSFRRSTPAQIRAMVNRVLTEDSFRRRAGELREALRAAGGLIRAADIAEEALTTRRPVTRKSASGAPADEASIQARDMNTDYSYAREA
jgi:MGT family glycosyltransferase